MADVLEFLEAFVNMSLRSACFTDEALLWQKPKPLVFGLVHTVIAELLGYLTMDMSDQNVESSGMITNGSVCKNLATVLTYFEVLPQNFPGETEENDKAQSE